MGHGGGLVPLVSQQPICSRPSSSTRSTVKARSSLRTPSSRTAPPPREPTTGAPAAAVHPALAPSTGTQHCLPVKGSGSRHWSPLPFGKKAVVTTAFYHCLLGKGQCWGGGRALLPLRNSSAGQAAPLHRWPQGTAPPGEEQCVTYRAAVPCSPSRPLLCNRQHCWRGSALVGLVSLVGLVLGPFLPVAAIEEGNTHRTSVCAAQDSDGAHVQPLDGNGARRTVIPDCDSLSPSPPHPHLSTMIEYKALGSRRTTIEPTTTAPPRGEMQ